MLRCWEANVVWSWYLGDPGVDRGIGDRGGVAYGIGTKTFGLRDRKVLDNGIVDAIVIAKHFVFRQVNEIGAEGRKSAW